MGGSQRKTRIALALGAAAAIAGPGRRILGRPIVAMLEGRKNRLHRPPPYRAGDRARALHGRLTVADLHADSLFWGRDLVRRSRRGHVDVPRLIEGNVALEVFAAATRVPRHLNIEHNDDRTDDVLPLAIASGWPVRTWASPLERALYLADRLRRMADASDGRLTVIESAAGLDAHLAARERDPARTAGLLAIEGAQALEGEVANVDVLADAGYRMISPAHFYDTEFGGSAHGVGKGGLTALGRELLARMDERAESCSTSRMPRPRRSTTCSVSRAVRSSPPTRAFAASPTTPAT